MAHNGNGNVEWATIADTAGTTCVPNEPIYFDFPPDTPLEFQKPLGTGTSLWPNTPASYPWSLACLKKDTLGLWFSTAANRDAFAHMSHTFTHQPMNNATGSDADKEMKFNIAWMKQIGLWSGNKFSPAGLIPPAITGTHNGDVLQSWWNNGIRSIVGDNSRSVLLNQVSTRRLVHILDML